MSAGPRRFFALALATILAWPALIAVVERSAFALPATVGVVAPRGSRLADDLRRELGASSFVVVTVEATARDWRTDARRLPGTQVLHGVAVRADEQLMTVFTRAATSTEIQAHFEQKVESGDRLARRRACLSIVEYLRVLSEGDPPPSIDLTGSTTGRVAPVPAPTASASVSAAASPLSSAAPPAAAAVPPVKAAMPAPTPPSPPSPPQSTHPGTSSSKQAAPVETAIGGPPPAEAIADPDRLWELGIGTTLGLTAAPGGPTAHLQFLWYLPLEWRLAVCVRGLWPVLGGQFRNAGNEVRTWTFGSGVSMQYLFELGPTRLQPFVGASLGARVALTETSPLEGLQSRKTFTPSGYLGADGGVRYALGPRVKLFVEVGLAHGWLVPGVHRLDYEEDAANADSFHGSFGILFEI